MNAATNQDDSNHKREAESSCKAGQLADLQPLDEQAETVKGGPLLLPAVQSVR